MNIGKLSPEILALLFGCRDSGDFARRGGLRL